MATNQTVKTKALNLFMSGLFRTQNKQLFILNIKRNIKILER